MRHTQAFGMLLVALGVVLFFLTQQLWSRTKLDPLWLIRGEFRDLLGPGTAQVLNAFLLVLGALSGSGSVSLGLFFLRSV